MRVTCLFLVFTSVLRTNGLECIKRDRCSCVYDDGSGMIDLSSLSRTDGNPLFLDQVASIDNFWYSYNPCDGFNEGTCQNVVVCRYDYSTITYADGGTIDSAFFNYNGFTTDINYVSADGVRTSVVGLVCDPAQTTPVFQVTGELQTDNYYMQLTSAAACKVPVPIESGSTGGISPGSILIIIFVVSSVIYVIVGVGYNKYRHGSTGRELVPNINFWQALPGLVKDGFGFLKARICRQSSYETM